MIVKIRFDAHQESTRQSDILFEPTGFAFPHAPLFPLGENPDSSVYVGILNETGFETARSVMADLQSFFDYNDWLDAREAFHIGLAMEGISVRVVPIEFDGFAAWCHTEGVRPTESALDAYAEISAKNLG